MKLLIGATDEPIPGPERFTLELYSQDKQVIAQLLFTQRGTEDLLRLINSALDDFEDGKSAHDALRVVRI
jgi:hypothetical protein